MVPIHRSCDVENMDDFSRYYSSSWIGWHGSDAAHIQPCYVQGRMDAERVAFTPLAKTADGSFATGSRFYSYWSDVKEHIDFGMPDIGMLQDGPTVVFVSYKTPRIARKGYRPREAFVSDFNHWDIRKKYNNRQATDRYDWVWFAFNPEYKSLEQSEALINKGEAVGLPLSRTLAIYSQPKFKHTLLAYKRWTIGHVINPYLIQIKPEYGDYEEDVARQTGAEVIVG